MLGSQYSKQFIHSHITRLRGHWRELTPKEVFWFVSTAVWARPRWDSEVLAGLGPVACTVILFLFTDVAAERALPYMTSFRTGQVSQREVPGCIIVQAPVAHDDVQPEVLWPVVGTAHPPEPNGARLILIVLPAGRLRSILREPIGKGVHGAFTDPGVGDAVALPASVLLPARVHAE